MIFSFKMGDNNNLILLYFFILFCF